MSTKTRKYLKKEVVQIRKEKRLYVYSYAWGIALYLVDRNPDVRTEWFNLHWEFLKHLNQS